MLYDINVRSNAKAKYVCGSYYMVLKKRVGRYSEVSIIEKLPLEKNHTYLIIFLRTGQVQNYFYCTIILTYDLRFNKLFSFCFIPYAQVLAYYLGPFPTSKHTR